jgi:hypothetical protein
LRQQFHPPQALTKISSVTAAIAAQTQKSEAGDQK